MANEKKDKSAIWTPEIEEHWEMPENLPEDMSDIAQQQPQGGTTIGWRAPPILRTAESRNMSFEIQDYVNEPNPPIPGCTQMVILEYQRPFTGGFGAFQRGLRVAETYPGEVIDKADPQVANYTPPEIRFSIRTTPALQVGQGVQYIRDGRPVLFRSFYSRYKFFISIYHSGCCYSAISNSCGLLLCSGNLRG